MTFTERKSTSCPAGGAYTTGRARYPVSYTHLDVYKRQVLERWYDLDSNGRLVNQGFEEGGTLTFGDTLWTYEVLDGPPGEYAIGFIVEDLDGNRVETYTDVTVE